MNSSLPSRFISFLTLALGSLVATHVSAQTAGTLDATFQPPQLHIVFDVAARTNGKVLVGGGTHDFLSPATFVQLLENGSPDPAFNTGTGPNGVVLDMLLLPDGKVIIGGAFTAYNGASRTSLARVNVDGSLDATFLDAGFDGLVNRIARQSDDKLLVTGDFTSILK